MTDAVRTGFSPRRIAWAAWLLACTPLAVSTSAGAVVAPSIYLSVEPTIPVGGVVMGSVQCLPACTASLPVFSASDGTSVTGRFAGGTTGAAGSFIFIPEPPLAAGNYSAYVIGAYAGSTAPFTVVDVPFELPTFTSSVVAETVPEGDEIRCQQQDANAPSAWFTQKTRVRPRVTVSFTGPYARQYRYALALAGETPAPVDGVPVQRSFDVEGDELCFDILGFSYQDAAVTPIGHDCVSLAGLGAGVGDRMSGDFKQTLLGCVVPPMGYESDWCATFQGAFASHSCQAFALDACFAARRGCPAGDQPSAQQEQTERDARATMATGGSSGTGSAGSAGRGGGSNGLGADSATGARVGAAPGAGAADTGHAGGSVASCSFGRGASGERASWLLLCAPLLLRARRKRGQASALPRRAT